MGDDIRQKNIARNKAFLENLGIGNNSAIRISSHLRRNAASNSGQKAASNSDVVETPPGGPRRSTRAKRIREGENHIEFKCKKCNVDKVFLTLHGLHLHQRRTCSASTNYKPKGFYGFTEEEYNQIFHLDTMTTKSSTIANEDRAISNTNQPMTIIEQDIFDVANECNTDEVSNQKITKDIALVEATTSETLISTFANLQNKLCSYLFGDKFITCKTYEEVINCIQCHYDTRNSNKVLHDANVYNFYLESGLSRKNGNKLLSVIRSFNPVFPVPRSINGIETRIKKSMKQHNNVIKLSIPWIDKWKMNELKGFQPIKIYVRNMFEVISHMLIDPEIMLLWRNHFKLKYFKATDQQGNHVYSDVMSSEWALHSELMVHEKDPNGHLMPLIFYTDGVQVSSNIHNKITPVIVTLGNFSDSLLQRDISKRVIAYLPNFKCYSKALMISHITSKCGISKTKAKQEVAQFELLVERTLYAYLVKQIDVAWEKGLKYHVLGYENSPFTFYPCISFFCGDDPCQHRISGLQEGNAKHGCVYCMFPTTSGSIYSPNVHRPRDAVELSQLCAVAEDVTVVCMASVVRVPLSVEQKRVLKTLKFRNVHPHTNPFHFAYMGYNNDIYKANPPDLLHLFCAGLMKSLTQWTLTIILEINSKFENKIALFDGRIHNFPYVAIMPHLNWSFFRGGIVQFATRSKREKLLATGSFGGFRSTVFISALLQIYFSIGFNDDILPNAELEYSKGNHSTSLKLKNVRNKVQQAIKALLDVYFDCKRKEWKPDYVNAFERKLTVMEVHLKLVWELKQALVNAQTSETMPVKMRNLHKHIHLPVYIRTFGSLLHLDTSTYESFHKVATTAIWQRTSKRHNGLFEEMINNIIQHDFHRLHDITNQIVTKGLHYADDCNSIDGVRFQRIMNTSAFPFLVTHDDSKFCTECDNYDKQMQQQYWRTVCVQTCLNSPEKFRSFLFKYHFGQAITHAYPDIKWDRRFAVNYETKIIQGISFSSDEQSQMGKGTIYSTARYNKNDSRDDHVDKPRHDFVFIEFGSNTPVLARVLMIIAIEKIPEDNNLKETAHGEEDTTIMLLIQLMSKIEHGAKVDIPGIGDLYQWAAGETSTSFCYDIIAVQTIVRPVFVIPIFREGYNQTRPSTLDRFIAIDRNYFDRSGWLENDSAIANIVSDQVNYLNSNQTGRMLVTIARDEVAEEQNIIDSMEDEDDDAAGIILDDSSSDDINISDNEDY